VTFALGAIPIPGATTEGRARENRERVELDEADMEELRGFKGMQVSGRESMGVFKRGS
jgi:diketogulonate reductase-like aldo/keto reductase